MRIHAAATAFALAISTAAFAQQQPKPVPAEIFARLPQSVGNIAFTPDNQLIFSHHPFYEPDLESSPADIADDFRALSNP